MAASVKGDDWDLDKEILFFCEEVQNGQLNETDKKFAQKAVQSLLKKNVNMSEDLQKFLLKL